MGYLLNIMIAVAALGFADFGWRSPEQWPWMACVLACVPIVLGRALHGRVIRGRFRSAEFLGRMLAISPPICFVLLVAAFGWCESNERWFGSSGTLIDWPKPALFVVIAPFVLYQWLAIEARARALWTPQASRKWSAFQTRMFLSALLPIGVYLAASIAIGFVPELRTRIEMVAFYNALFAVVMLVVVGLSLPFLLRNTWETEPIESGLQRTVLQTVAQAAKFEARDLLVWRTGGTMANAAIVGLGRRTRVVLFSDLLLAQLDPRELAAVFAHEIGHAKRKHVLVFVALAGGFFLSVDWLGNHILGLSVWIATAFVIVSLALGYFGFGWLSRRFELEADLYSLALLRDPQALIDALEKVGGSFRDVASWRHFSTARRIEFLVRATNDARVGHRLLRLLRYVTIAAFLWFATALAVQTWEVTRQFDEELVHVDLALGDYSSARERITAMERPPEDLARIVRRTHELDAVRGSVEELERRARTALRSRDAVAAHDWLSLAAFRERDDLDVVAEAVRALHADAEADVRAAMGEELWSAWGADLDSLRAR